MDYLEIVHYLVWIAGVVVVVAALILAFENRASRNLPLATGVVVGAVTAFLIQVSFEATSTTRSHHLSFAYTFDLAKKELRADYSKITDMVLTTGRLSTEIDAGQWIFTAIPSMNEGDRRKVVSDFTLLSTLAYFGQGDRDWQWRTRNYNAPTLGFSSIMPLSRPSECTKVTDQEIRALLRKAGNSFADMPHKIAFTDICLPPNTALDISSTAVILRNPVVRIELTIDDPGGGNYIQPGSTTMEVPQLPDGHPRFETYLRALNIEITFSRFRANHPLREKYEQWSKSVVERLNIWFACC